MADDLVQRLRSNRPIPTLPHEAADRIEEMDRHLILSGKMSKALSDRIEALEAENKWLRERVKRVENNNRELRGSKERIYAATDLRQPTQSDALREENERLREHLISALDTLKDAEVCDDNCSPCNEARAELAESK